MDDLISRQAAIKAVSSMFAPTPTQKDMVEDCLKIIENLPSAEVEPVKRGRWTPHSEICREYIGTVLVNVEYDYWFCDACGYQVKGGRPMYNFCPNCGAKMEVGEE